jgi:hypothetical protein
MTSDQLTELLGAVALVLTGVAAVLLQVRRLLETAHKQMTEMLAQSRSSAYEKGVADARSAILPAPRACQEPRS